MLAKKVQEMPPEDRICFSVFDEMSLRVYLHLQQKHGLVAGFVDLCSFGRRPQLAEEVLVAMVRSIYGTWKLPFAFWLTDKKLQATDFAKIFEETNSALLEVGLDLRAQVTDGLQKNLAAEHLLGASYERPWYFLEDKKIVTLVDVRSPSGTPSSSTFSCGRTGRSSTSSSSGPSCCRTWKRSPGWRRRWGSATSTPATLTR
ncbi:hypothetical protein ONE63_005053 [Megalurothrips usitatus]|uniref:Transposable element P transposase-like RNase H domain-containing protein n=1 Tax=Megalurothrips usitatus TaxID=439358 RepID=A0AAV7X448_9NEOP|nr:hypothetical protein ONE63_005053 [Megalurothrips usitatus]